MSEVLQNQACAGCPAHKLENLRKLGLDMRHFDYVVALAGNPNTGKSTVFNSLTGLRQHTGNWPGKTVTRAEGGFAYKEKKYKLVDLPGTYSLLSASQDEEIARNFLLFGQPDVTIIVVDATRLERNLNLVLQVLEITSQVVLCVNLMDEARRHGLMLDERALGRDLGVPVVPAAARAGEGIPLLLETLHGVASGTIACRPHRIDNQPPALKDALNQLVSRIEAAFPGLPNARWVALRLLEGDERMVEAVRSKELQALAAPRLADAASQPRIADTPRDAIL
jgi:Fe2+ transport system protein B